MSADKRYGQSFENLGKRGIPGKKKSKIDPNL
jgi:hypothetical protein